MELLINENIKKMGDDILKNIPDFYYIIPEKVYYFETHNSKSRCYARIHQFSRIFQMALNIEPIYCIEFLFPIFGRLSFEEQQKVVIHELLHIPTTFSGALRAHKFGKQKLNKRLVNKYYKIYLENKQENCKEEL